MGWIKGILLSAGAWLSQALAQSDVTVVDQHGSLILKTPIVKKTR